jgi:hypothetical protein
VALGQFRDERTRQERQVSAWRAFRSGGETALAHSQAKPRPLSLRPSPVASPIHHHAPGGDAIGPQTHTDLRTTGDGTAQSAGLHRTNPAGEALRGAPGTGTVPAITHRQGAESISPMSHSFRPGAETARDTGLTAGHRAQLSAGHDAGLRSETPRLHAPAQFTHRQPPPAPKPVSRNEHQSNHNNP